MEGFTEAFSKPRARAGVVAFAHDSALQVSEVIFQMSNPGSWGATVGAAVKGSDRPRTILLLLNALCAILVDLKSCVLWLARLVRRRPPAPPSSGQF